MQKHGFKARSTRCLSTHVSRKRASTTVWQTYQHLGNHDRLAWTGNAAARLQMLQLSATQKLAVAYHCHDRCSPSEVPTPSKVPSALTSKAVMGAWQILLCRRKFISPLCRSCITDGGASKG